MTLPLRRSESINQTNRASPNSALHRSVSYSNRSQFSSHDIPKISKLGHVKNFMTDANAQMNKFVKEYPQYWDLCDTNIFIRYLDAKKILPQLASQLQRRKLESLLSVKNILRNMKDNLASSLNPSTQNDGGLSSYLEQAEHSIENAVFICVDGTSDFHSEKPEQKNLNSSNDIMSAAMIIKQYFTDMINTIGKQENVSS